MGRHQFAADRAAAFSDIRFVFEDQVAAEGNRVVSRLRIRLTHYRGELAGFAPSSKEHAMTAIIINRIEGGKIVEEWTEASDLADLTRQRLEQEERERLEQELQVARRIQQASLPKEVPEPEGWQTSPLYQPAREVGGDFYDFHLLSEGRLGLVVGDAAGQGGTCCSGHVHHLRHAPARR